MSHPEQQDIYSVSRLNNEIKGRLESSFPALWVEGEISNLARPASGHLYFSLKDPASQVRCAMFRSHNRHLSFEPENGLHVLARARVGLYVPRGEFQLVVESMQKYGEGALQEAFEALKRRLAEEGLFAADRKRPLPRFPKRIGVITSPTGAAIRDILSVLGRRFPAIPVQVYPVPVQGEGAAPAIASALRKAGEQPDCAVLILARGGGSLEDLQAFNDERVARAIAACAVPLVTGVGHEVDYTIADFVADHRAPTPSAAAETVTPDQAELRQRMRRMEERLLALTRSRIQLHRQRLNWLHARVKHPRGRLMELSQRLDALAARLSSAEKSRLQREASRLAAVSHRLHRRSPAVLIQMLQARSSHLAARLEGAWRHGQSRQRARLAELVRALDSVSPLGTLHRGYAMITSHPDGKLIRSVGDTSEQRQINARLGDGSLLCTVDARDSQNALGVHMDSVHSTAKKETE